ncbi:hypothetical protein ACK33E_14090 [Aeromonas hydrophila]|uniref:hypothetical protein n=1 Tax=Aeromonas hydrophila TaxID=644 RepID=UPI00398A4184
MNVHEQSLALAMAWLDSVDDDVFLQEYNAIAQYTSTGPTVDEFIAYSADCYPMQLSEIIFESQIEFANYIDLGAIDNFIFDSVRFKCGNATVNASSAFDKLCGNNDNACNDENYSLAA